MPAPEKEKATPRIIVMTRSISLACNAGPGSSALEPDIRPCRCSEVRPNAEMGPDRLWLLGYDEFSLFLHIDDKPPCQKAPLPAAVQWPPLAQQKGRHLAMPALVFLQMNLDQKNEAPKVIMPERPSSNE